MPESVSHKIDTALKSLAHDGELSIRISGNCMQPLIMDGALVCVQKQAVYWPGDVLVKRNSVGQLIAHRLIGFYPRRGKLYFVCRADNAQIADAAVAGAQIIGRVSGGECSKSVVSVPLGHRIRAIGQFTLLATRGLARRLAKILRS